MSLYEADAAAWEAGGRAILDDVTMSGTPDTVRQRLAALADVYVDDAFGAAHRAFFGGFCGHGKRDAPTAVVAAGLVVRDWGVSTVPLWRNGRIEVTGIFASAAASVKLLPLSIAF